MTNTEAITKLTNIAHDDIYAWHPSILEAFRMAVDALRGADGDCISRRMAIEALCKAGCNSGYCGVSCDDVKAIEDLPSAQPEQKQANGYLLETAINVVNARVFTVSGQIVKLQTIARIAGQK